jgi:hypothetical protein
MTGEQLHADVVTELFWDPKAGSGAGRRPRTPGKRRRSRASRGRGRHTGQRS